MLKFPVLRSIQVSKVKHAASITLSSSKSKCGAIEKCGKGLVVSTGLSPTPSDFKKAVYTCVNRANQLRKEEAIDEVGVLVNVPSLSFKADSTATGLLWQTSQPRQFYGKRTAKSIVVERAATYASLSSYRYNRFKKDVDAPAKLVLQGTAGVTKSAVAIGNIIADCVADARSLGNLRHDEGNPTAIADWIRQNVVNQNKIRLKHEFVGDGLVDAGLTMLHAVGKGATHAPRMMVLEYIGSPKAKDTVALVGKGVTFDCGGLNVKPFGSMETMHLDKMGAVAVVCALRGIAALKLKVNVVAVVGLVENAIGPTSYHPSTILRSLSGKTVEVTNTDAEGRLILADMLTFVQNKANTTKRVSSIIDLATLTGAIVMALGDRRAGVFCNDASLLRGLVDAGSRVDELMWPMPIGQEHRDHMKGKLSDLTNCRTKREGGSCTAAAFLQEFIRKETKWAHIDIAGPAMEETEKLATLTGAPGFGVQLLIDYFRNL